MLNRGSYQWKIKSTQQIQKILTSQPDICFNSDVFEMCKLQWMLQLYPNGHLTPTNTTGDVGLFVKILIFPKSWKNILVHQTLICHETNTISYNMQRYQSSATS